MKSILTYFISIISLLLITSCIAWKEKKVIITKDYVINPNWDAANNSFRIYQMKLKDSVEAINLKNPSPDEILRRLEKDKSFAYTANVVYNEVKYAKRKVFFDKNNGFLWYKLTFDTKVMDLENGKYKIGELKRSSWYLFTGLSNVRTLYYVYIDTAGNLYSFEVKASHYTNY